MYTYNYMSSYTFIETMWYEMLYEYWCLGILKNIRIGYLSSYTFKELIWYVQFFEYLYSGVFWLIWVIIRVITITWVLNELKNYSTQK